MAPELNLNHIQTWAKFKYSDPDCVSEGHIIDTAKYVHSLMAAQLEAVKAENVKLNKANDEIVNDSSEDLYNKAIQIRDLKVREAKLVEALKKINREELNSQRPGGGYSRSATLSYEALASHKKLEG